MSPANRPLLLTLTVACLAAATTCLPPPDRPLTAPLDCSGWPEPRVYFEGQAWWTDPGKNVHSQSVHLHVGTCFPYNQTVSNIVTMDVLVQLHGGKSALNASLLMQEITVQATFSNITVIPEASRVSSGAWTCTSLNSANAAQDCKMAVRVMFDTRTVPNGQVVAKIKSKFRAGLNSNANIPLAVQGPLNVNNRGPQLPMAQRPYVVNQGFTGPANDLIVNVVGGAPWFYTFLGFRAGDLLLTTPDKPAKGVFEVPAYLQTTSNARRANFTRGFVSLNPKFHDVPPKLGQVLIDVNSGDNKRSCGNLRVWPKVRFNSCLVNATVDTRSLKTGPQRVFVRGDLRVNPSNAVFGRLPSPPENPWDTPAPGPGTLSIAALLVVHVAK